VDTYNPGSYSISYRATDSYGNESLVERKVEVGKSAGQKEQKTIYLTFDDGPSEGVTPKILEILRKNKVPATFFILDYGDNEEKKRLLKTAISEGHTIGIHGYSHDYDEIYKSVPDYMENVSKLDKKIQRDLDYKPFVMRFPGGSSNTVSVSLKKGIMSELVKKVQEEGYYYSDWNVDSTDASGNNIDKNTIISSVEKNCSKKGYNIVLMHDTDAKRTTAEALPEIIKWAKKEGYTFKAMERGGPTVHHRVNN
jgi:peptidoglycan/xylan/chitin deacetylase (PgdA/CDA1 family)